MLSIGATGRDRLNETDPGATAGFPPGAGIMKEW